MADSKILFTVSHPEEREITDKDSDVSDDEVNVDFLHLPRRLPNSEAQVSSKNETRSAVDDWQNLLPPPEMCNVE